MRQFYRTFPIRQTLSSELSWSHYNLLMRIEDTKARDFYANESVKSNANKIINHQVTHQDTHQDKILEFCKVPRTTKEIMLHLGLKDRRSFSLRHMRPLLDSGKLEMTIPEKPNAKNQKYITKINN